MKKKRNQALAKKYRDMPCEVCGIEYAVSGHHLISFKSRPDLDIPQNIKALCVNHHSEIHSIGLRSFCSKYGLFNELDRRGFYYDETSRKYMFGNKLVLKSGN